MARRRREPRYDAPVSGRIPAGIKARLEAVADRENRALGAVLRQVIEAGLPLVEGGEIESTGEASPEQARRWWDGLSRQERSKWGRRLRHIEGDAFRREAYRQAMDGAEGQSGGLSLRQNPMKVLSMARVVSGMSLDAHQLRKVSARMRRSGTWPPGRRVTCSRAKGSQSASLLIEPEVGNPLGMAGSLPAGAALRTPPDPLPSQWRCDLRAA